VTPSILPEVSNARIPSIITQSPQLYFKFIINQSPKTV